MSSLHAGSSSAAESSPRRARVVAGERRLARSTFALALTAWPLLAGASFAAAEGGRDGDHEAGLPLVRSSRGRDLAQGGSHVDPQMFGFAQGNDGLLYVANAAGVLVFDGARWENVAAADGATVLSLAVGPDGTIWVGASGAFGRLVAGPGGELAYERLDGGVADEDSDFGDVWDTVLHEDAVYFRTPQRLFRWRDGTIAAFRPRGRGFGVARRVGSRLFVRDAEAGLFVVQDGEPVLAPDGDLLADLSFTVVLPLADERVLIGTRSQGLFGYDPRAGTARARRLEPFATEAAGWLEEHQLYSGAALPDGRMVLGTLRGGSVMLEPSGRPRWHLGRRQGLADDTVLAAFADRSHDVWLGLNDGLTLVETSAGLTLRGEAAGLRGFVESVARSQGRLYVATGLGVARLESSASPFAESSFSAVDGLLDQAWSVVDAGDALLAGNEQGVFEVRGLSSRRLLEGETYVLARGEHEDLFWAGQDGGLAWLQRADDGTWSSGRVAGVATVVRYVVEQPRDVLWLGTDFGELLRVDLAPGEGYPSASGQRSYGQPDGLSKGAALPIRFRDRLVVSGGGLFLWDEGSDRFSPDPRFPPELAHEHGAQLCPMPDGRVVLSAGHRMRLLAPNGDRLEPSPSIVDRVPLGNRLISCLVEDAAVWLGTDDGLFRWDVTASQRRLPEPVRIRHVRRDELVLASSLPGRDAAPGRLPWRRGSIRFELALPSFGGGERNEYRTLLEGFDEGWTPWTREAWRELTNLPPGRYRLRAQGRDASGVTAQEAVLALEIAPPWYRSVPAWLGYGATATLALLGVGQLQVRAVRRRNRELQVLVDERTAELRAASVTDPLTGLHNRRFFDEVIAAEIAAVRRSRTGEADARELVFCLIDLDHFKTVNDQLGHAGGDDFLHQVSERLRAVCREGDLLFRWGGEELLLLARDSRRDDAVDLARRLLWAIGEQPVPIRLDPSAAGTAAPTESWPLTCSIGFAAFPFFADAPEGATLDGVLRFADAALYEAKRGGRNRACGALPALPFAVVLARWPDWQRQTIAEAAELWLTLVVAAGPSAALPGDGSA